MSFDVRSLIENGTDPFKEIMMKVSELEEDQTLEIINSFEPIPLINVLKSKGFSAEVKRKDNLVYTSFRKEERTESAEKVETTNSEETNFDKVYKSFIGKMKYVDVRHLDMPEPMTTIFEELDIGMQYSMLAIAAIFVPFILFGFMIFNTGLEIDFLNRIITFYGFSIIFGLISTLILGQTYKTLPFIVWLNKYKHLVGKTKTPLPRTLYSEKIARVQQFLYFIFILCFVAGLLLNELILIKVGSYALLMMSILYNVNIFKIITHKVKPLKNG